MKILFFIIALGTGLSAMAANLQCIVMLENRDGVRTTLLEKKVPLDAQLGGSIKETFIVDDEDELNLFVVASASDLMPGTATITSMQLAVPGWEALKFPKSGTYVKSFKRRSYVQEQELFLAVTIGKERFYVQGTCSI